MIQDKWNEKYSCKGFLYGDKPNTFIEENSHYIKKGSKVLCLGAGEGRNAIYLAKEGFIVDALDASDVGLKKLQKRANKESVYITIRHTFIEHWKPQCKYDAIISTFTQLNQSEQANMLTKSIESLSKGGFLIVEFFSKDQLNFNSGGPKDEKLLTDLTVLHQLFSNLNCTIYKLSQEIVKLQEGQEYNGEASVIKVIIKKTKED